MRKRERTRNSRYFAAELESLRPVRRGGVAHSGRNGRGDTKTPFASCCPMVDDGVVTHQHPDLSFVEILGRFDAAVARLFEDDQHLFLHDVSDRAITHKLGEYLQPLFPGWNVDCE